VRGRDWVWAVGEYSSGMGNEDGISRRPSDDARSSSRIAPSRSRRSPRVVVADDHPFFRTSLAHMLRENGIEVAAEVPSGEGAIRAVAETAPHVVVMDLKMPGVSGIEATRRLTSSYPATHVLVLSVSAEENDVIEAVLAGASGYVLKDAPPDELIGGINAAADGEPIVSPRIAAALLRRIVEAIRAGEGLADVAISGQELQILDLLADGRSGAELAAALGIEEHDVHAYTWSLLTKLRVDSAVHAALRKLGPAGS
jgi:DNA-binding NarL/FixJ family response regulator